MYEGWVANEFRVFAEMLGCDPGLLFVVLVVAYLWRGTNIRYEVHKK